MAARNLDSDVMASCRAGAANRCRLRKPRRARQERRSGRRDRNTTGRRRVLRTHHCRARYRVAATSRAGARSAERLEQDLAAARRDVETQTALTAKTVEETARVKQAAQSGAAELQNSLQQERERAERLEQDLATARSRNAGSAGGQGEEAARTRQTAERDSTAVRNSLQQERARAEWLERDLALAQGVAPTIGPIGRNKPVEEGANPIVDRAPAEGARGDAQPNSEEAAVAAGLIGRTSALLRQGRYRARRGLCRTAPSRWAAPRRVSRSQKPMIHSCQMGNIWDARRCDQSARSLCEGRRRWNPGGECLSRGAASVAPMLCFSTLLQKGDLPKGLPPKG
jgi:hypothetical protein